MSLQSISQAQLSKSFESLPFAPEDKLTAAAATALFAELPVSCAASLAEFLDSELYYKRACSQVAVLGCRIEEHGLSFKRLFCEVTAQELLRTTVNLSRSIAENIFTLRACSHDFPLDQVCSQLPNLNRLDIKYGVATSSHAHARLEAVPRALNVSTNVISLTLQDSSIDDNDVATLFGNNSCTNNNTILNLNLGHNNITSLGLGVIVNHFIAPPTSVLSSLDMMGNRIKSEGGSVLGQGLATNDSLLSLNLRLNSLGDDGGSALLKCIEDNATLRYLNMSANNLASRSANALVALLESNESLSLETIIITTNQFSDEDEEAIKACKQCFLDVRGGSSPVRQEMFLGKNLLPF